MNVVDASGWLEYFGDGPDAAFVAQTLQETERLVVPTLTILEVFGEVLRTHGEGPALQAAAAMQQGRVVTLDTTAALDGGRFAAAHEIEPAAGAVFGVAERHSAKVWTLDDALRHVPGVEYRARARGNRPASW